MQLNVCLSFAELFNQTELMGLMVKTRKHMGAMKAQVKD